MLKNSKVKICNNVVIWLHLHWNSIQTYLSKSTSYDLTYYNNVTTLMPRSKPLIGQYYNSTSEDLWVYKNKSSDLLKNHWLHCQRSTKPKFQTFQKRTTSRNGSTEEQPCTILEGNLAQKHQLVFVLEGVTTYRARKYYLVLC